MRALLTLEQRADVLETGEPFRGIADGTLPYSGQQPLMEGLKRLNGQPAPTMTDLESFAESHLSHEALPARPCAG